MEFGVFHQFPSLPGRSDADTFAEAFEQIDAAEELGLDVIWLSELHFDPQRSVLSAPLSIASAIAARTRRIKIGTAVQVLPLCHPLRLAEEGATVDQISRGRLIFGVGRSGLPRTYEDYGVSYAESRARFAEALEIVEQAWSQPAVNYDGKYYSFHNIAVTPKPYQQPYPPIRIAAASPDTYPAVGARGLPILINARLGTFSEFAPAVREYREAYKAAFINPRLGSFSEFAPAVREYREAYEAAGYPGKGRVYLRVPTYLAETEGRARAEPQESLMHFIGEAIARLKDSMSRPGTRAIEGRAQRLQRLENLTYDEALQGQVLIGTPASVIERLRDLQDELGLDGILAELNTGGLIPHAKVMSAMRLLCAEVMPRFQ
jgi:alkanesulfonate monooxygenase SsuD/methylene tetrahydromethanopterin reductase-like flavin-dependent oxidoreductase (luciferase family)